MADYLLKGDAFIDGVRRRKGETVSFDGKPSQVMQELQRQPKPKPEALAPTDAPAVIDAPTSEPASEPAKAGDGIPHRRPKPKPEPEG